MKKFNSILALVLAVVMCVGVFAACAPTSNPTGTATADDGDKVTVTWYGEGTKVLKEEKVEKGTKLTSWTPEAPAEKAFDGWFAEASRTTAFNFDTAIEADTDIFAKFTSTAFEADETQYYLIGAGAGDMGKANWDHANAAANLAFTKEDVANANVFSITITMYAGDMFQICHDGSWDGQVGIGYVAGAEYCDGVNFYDNNEYTAADKKVAQVKDADGNVIFIGSDEYNKGYETWNVKLADGQDGVYKITYTTYPAAPDKNQITFELVEKVSAQTETHKMYFIGTMNEWATEYADDTLAFKPSDDKKTWTAIITITEDMYADWTETDEANYLGVKCAALKVYNTVNGEYIGLKGANIYLTAGTYSFKYSVDGNKVDFAVCKYYVVGTFLDENGAAVNFAVKEGVTPELTVVDGIASGVITGIDATGLGDFSWIKDQGKPGTMAIKVVYGSELGIDTWYSDDANGGDNWYVNNGETYIVSLDIAAGTVTVTSVVAD